MPAIPSGSRSTPRAELTASQIIAESSRPKTFPRRRQSTARAHNKAPPRVYWEDGSGSFHPYTVNLTTDGFTGFTVAGAVSAQATGINDSGEVSGLYIDSAGVNHGEVIIGGTRTTIDFPGATLTQPLGVNNLGRAVEGFAQSTIQNGIGTTLINGINAAGDIVGFYVDSTGNTAGFEASPGRWQKGHLILAGNGPQRFGQPAHATARCGQVFLCGDRTLANWSAMGPEDCPSQPDQFAGDAIRGQRRKFRPRPRSRSG